MFVFFFKQKTAYEMRISDWSSDVCSSDLTGYPERAVYVAQGRIEIDGAEYRSGQMAIFSADGTPCITALEASRLMLLGGEPLGARHIWWNFVSSRKEIGRASCRDRVCQSV